MTMIIEEVQTPQICEEFHLKSLQVLSEFSLRDGDGGMFNLIYS